MNILIVVPAFPLNLDEVKGGVTSALSNLLRGIAHTHAQVRVLTFNRGLSAPHRYKYANNITICYTPESRLPHVYNFATAGAKVIHDMITEFQPALVHYAMSGYILFTRIKGLQGKPAVVTIHGVPFKEVKQKKTLKDKVVFFTNGVVEKLLCPENIIHISEYSSREYAGTKTRHTTVIPNAINPVYFDLPLRDTTGNRIIYIGTIEPRKNLLFALQVLRELVAAGTLFHLTIVGGSSDAAYYAEVQRYVTQHELQTYTDFKGWMKQEEVQPLLAASDILLLPSLQETLPMVIAEAMSAGKLAICSKVGGIPEMITDGEDGYLIDTHETAQAVSLLQQLHNNHALVSRLQQQARVKAQGRYHCDSVAKKTIAFYETVTAAV